MNVTLYGNRDFGVLRWGDYPRLSSWALNRITSVLITGKQRNIAHRGNVTTEARCSFASFEDGSRAYEPRNTGNAVLDSGRGKQTDFPLKLPDRG